MYTLNTLTLYDLTVEHLSTPLGIDCTSPRFGWKLHSDRNNTLQTSYRLTLTAAGECAGSSIIAADTGTITSDQSIEVTIPDWQPTPMTRYEVQVTVTDNYDRSATLTSWFETGRMGVPFVSSWVEPEQEPTPSSMLEPREESVTPDAPTAAGTPESGTQNSDNQASGASAPPARDFHEFRPSQYIRIPFRAKQGIRRARVYTTAHGLYRMKVNGIRPDDRDFAPENTAYEKILLYQTYDITPQLREGDNVIGVTLADGWWVGRVGTTGDCCQYGDRVGLLLDAEIEYMDGTTDHISGEQGRSATGPRIFSDLFVGEKYDARRELTGWSMPGYDDSAWIPVHKVDYAKDALVGQAFAPIRILKTWQPTRIFQAPNGDTILDAGQVLAGYVEFSLTTGAGHTITLEHSEVLDREGNYFNNILGVNKEQTDIYITRDGWQTYRPSFTYHGFRYVRITGWPGQPSVNDFKIHAVTSEMADIGSFTCSDTRLNQLQRNIWWSQVANTISIPTDCPQREKAGWTGDIMAFGPTLCFNRQADAFLTSWMDNVRAEQLESGAIPMIVPYLTAYSTFLKDGLGSDTSCGWGDAVIIVPYTVYKAYGDRRILEENYPAMKRWLTYIQGRAENHHPEEYATWDDAHRARSRYLWNTDFHFGDWLIPSLVLNNPDAGAMSGTAFATMRHVAPAYYGFSAWNMAEIAEILGQTEDAAYYRDLYEKIRQAFIQEYVHEDGTMDANFQGIYVIALKIGLVSDEVRPKMVEHLCRMIADNGNRLDTGFLSVLFLMDVLCENGRSDVAKELLYQTACPSWLYEVEQGATTMWESWGAIGEDGTVSTYSFNHYAFGCIGEWMYRTLGGLQILEPGYRKFRIAPSFDYDLTSSSVSEETPYGRAAVDWRITDGTLLLHAVVPVGTEAEILLPGREAETVGSGDYDFMITLK